MPATIIPARWIGLPLLLVLALSTVHGEEGWKLVSRSGEIEIFEKKHAGSDLLEYKGVGTFDAPPAVIKRVLDDVPAYPSFMPYVSEAKVLSTQGTSQVSYQRLSPPLVGDRDYTIRVQGESRPAAGGTAFITKWQTANEAGPAEIPKVTRVKTTEGSWLLEPADGGTTRATYTVFTDSGGSLPAFVLNTAGKTAVPKVFAAVRQQARQPKYTQDRH